MSPDPVARGEVGAPSRLDLEVRNHVLVICLDRPSARNAVDPEMAHELAAAIDRLEADDRLRAGVLRAAPVPGRPVFCAGADLKAVQAGGVKELSIGDMGFAGLTSRVRRKPLVAAVDGLATAGGFELVLSCDLIVASGRSSFGLAEARRGLVAGAGGLYRLAWAVGEREATRVALSDKPLTADRAYQLGLLTELVEDPSQVTEVAVEIAATIAECAPLAIDWSRRILALSRAEGESVLQRMSDEAAEALLGSNDVQEGIRAFLEGRMPRWTGT